MAAQRRDRDELVDRLPALGELGPGRGPEQGRAGAPVPEPR